MHPRHIVRYSAPFIEGGRNHDNIKCNRSQNQAVQTYCQAANTQQPIIITGKRKNAVLISEED
jgi:hypothetical protein